MINICFIYILAKFHQNRAILKIPASRKTVMLIWQCVLAVARGRPLHKMAILSLASPLVINFESQWTKGNYGGIQLHLLASAISCRAVWLCRKVVNAEIFKSLSILFDDGACLSFILFFFRNSFAAVSWSTHPICPTWGILRRLVRNS